MCKCELLRKAVSDSITEDEKLMASTSLRDHVLHAQQERSLYNKCIEDARVSFNSDGQDKYFHFKFDYSQNISVPHHSRQMGPLYFLSLRKIQIFGFREDGKPKQLNFLIDEADSIGKDGSHTHGPDSVISMLDWALNSYTTESFTMHAYNCGGQNKNQFMMGYLMWRILTGRQKKITYLMQVPGHTRCLIDAGFANIKKLYRRSDCESIDQVEKLVNDSSSTNIAVRYPSWQWKDWKGFLSRFFKRIPGVRRFHHFTFTSERPGEVLVKESHDSESHPVQILKKNDPEVIASLITQQPEVVPIQHADALACEMA